MKTLFLIILIITCTTVTISSAYASCGGSSDWPERPCYDAGDDSLEEKQNDWSFYYDHKGELWMEQKKYEMEQAIQTNSLSEWIELTNNTGAHYNVHFYYYLLGKAPNLDGEYIFVCDMYEDVFRYEEILKHDLVLQSFLEKFPLATSSISGIDESRPPQTSVFYEYDEQNTRASLLMRAFEGDDKKPCLVPRMYTVTYHDDSIDVNIRNSNVDVSEILKFLDSLYLTLSPLKQIKSGIALFDVQCDEGKYIVYKYNRMRAACVNGETETELINRGWALMRLGFPEYMRADFSSSLCGNYDGKWHPEYEGCRGDISNLQCSLMGGEFVDGLKICYDEICPVDKTYTLCVTNLDLISGETENEN